MKNWYCSSDDFEISLAIAQPGILPRTSRASSFTSSPPSAGYLMLATPILRHDFARECVTYSRLLCVAYYDSLHFWGTFHCEIKALSRISIRGIPLIRLSHYFNTASRDKIMPRFVPARQNYSPWQVSLLNDKFQASAVITKFPLSGLFWIPRRGCHSWHLNKNQYFKRPHIRTGNKLYESNCHR